MQIAELRTTIESLLDTNAGKPVVVFAALWPFLRALDIPQKDVAPVLLQMLQDVAGPERNLLMPTFTRGYQDGICNLDEEPASTGLLAESFRRLPNCERNLTAFFSYGILGPDCEEFADLMPEHAWGDGSAYDWMEKKNASFLMLGTHPTNCSYLHRMEWLARIKYRYVKPFTGKIIRRNREHEMTEKLFVRILTPPAINDFTRIYDDLTKNGMETVKLDGIHLAHMTATKMKAAFLPLLLKDPLISVENRQDFERNDVSYDCANN